MVNTFSQNYQQLCCTTNLSRQKKRLQQKPWITEGLLTSIKNKQKLYKTCFLNGNDADKYYFKIYSNKLTKVKNLSKTIFYNESTSEHKNNPKQLRRFIILVISAKISRDNFSHPLKLVDENDAIRNPPEISKKFNKYFAEIGLQISNTVNTSNPSNFKAYLRNLVSHSIFLEPPEPNEIFNIIRSLNIHKASGNDNISSFFLCLGGKVLAPILSVYFGYSLEHGIFPNIFKTAKVIPLFKSGSNENVNNYRPISLLPSLSKVLEKLIKFRFVKFFDRHNIFYAHQYGFRKKHSVIHALLDVISLSYDASQSKQYTALLLMDLRKAFDTASHHILMHKLYQYGIRGPAFDLIVSLLSSRYQFVSANKGFLLISILNSYLRPDNKGFRRAQP